MSKSYSELMSLKTFEERFEYLKLDGVIGSVTFGSKRYLYQKFLHSKEWRDFKRKIILRDNGCDLGLEGYEIHGTEPIIIHHINPVNIQDVQYFAELLMDPSNVISCRESTHRAIHYGDESSLIKPPKDRHLNDTCPWRKD